MTLEKKPAAFDASAIVAFLEGREAPLRELRPVIEAVFRGGRRGVMSLVNVAEVQYVAGAYLARQGQDVFDVLKHARIEVVGTNKVQTLLAAEAKRKVRELSLGDAFAFALAAVQEARLFTTDPGFDHPWIRERVSLTLLGRSIGG